MNPELIKAIRNMVPQQIAEELVNVQPIDPKVFKDLYENACSEEQLIAEGYEPIDPQSKMLWVKTT